ncbi:helicase associated domain-containing protein [Streptomyces sp. NPDC060027]|uniref:helicase associated domain-containing protein n=1 Tax=Streptomyces sp. NPDC060027 TaxID=3347040 RepID=UPI003678CF0E
MPAQQYLLETIGIDPDEGGPVRAVARSQDERWAVNLAAARQFHAREGHLHVPREAVEDVAGEQIKPGAFLDNARRRAGKLSEAAWGAGCFGDAVVVTRMGGRFSGREKRPPGPAAR